MKGYTTTELIRIFNRCNNAVELLNCKEIMQEIQALPHAAIVVFDLRMSAFLESIK